MIPTTLEKTPGAGNGAVRNHRPVRPASHDYDTLSIVRLILLFTFDTFHILSHGR